MRGNNHIVTGVAAAAVLVDTHLLLQSRPENTLSYRMSSGIFDIITDTAIPLWLYFGIGIFLYLLGVLLPDLDSPYSLIGKKLYLPIAHRTWLHSIWFVIPFAVGSIWVRVLFFLALGMFVHLFFDSFSRSGIKWFYPFSWRHSIKLYHTSQVSEYVCTGITVVLATLYSVLTVQCLYHIFPL